jgi:hypothetical protein
MDAAHARKHLDELGATLTWLRTLTPDNPRYKLWLGDLVEFTRVVFGLDSAEMAGVRAVLTEAPRPVPGSDESERTRAYLALLDRFAGVLTSLGRAFPQSVTLLDLNHTADEETGRG